MKIAFKTLFVSISLLGLGLSACSTSGDTTSNPSSSAEAVSSTSSKDSGGSSTVEKTYTITWKNSNGTVLETDKNVKEGSMPSYDGETPTKADEDRYTYTFKGWSPTVKAVSKNQTYVATYESTQVIYDIKYTLGGGTNSPDNPLTYRIGTTFTFKNASKTGYTFTGWYSASGTKITGITATTKGDVYLNARYSANKNTLSVTSEDTSKGTASVTSGQGYSGETIIVKAEAKVGYLFDGWYNNNKKVSGNASYTFTMPTNDYSLLAKFVIDEERDIRLGIKPNVSSDKKTLTYGLYPKDNIDDEDLISELNKLTTPESNGYYLYKDTYYAKTVAAPHENDYKFSNYTTIVSGKTYWFKCEPISWDILTSTDGEYYLLTSYIIDIHCYHDSEEKRVIDNSYVYPNNYEYSDIRAWLNGYDGSDYEVVDYSSTYNFINTAFGLNDDYIEEITVNNSASTTDTPSNPWACKNTDDKVFLLSYRDYLNPDLGFVDNTSSSITRETLVTDWAKARGIYYSAKYHPNCGAYWTRSPDDRKYIIGGEEYSSWLVNNYGGIGFDPVDYDADGVRPSIYLIIPEQNS